MADYTSTYSGGQIDTAVARALLLVAISGGDASKILQVNSGETAFELVTRDIVSGTSMIFYQASAPTGWTKSTSNNDKALRVVSGTGGGTGGTHGLSSPPSINHTHADDLAVSNHTLTISETALHGHPFTISTDNTGTGNDLGGFITDPDSISVKSARTGAASVGSGEQIGGEGGGTGHNHSLSGSVTSASLTAFAPQYIDVIVCTRN